MMERLHLPEFHFEAKYAVWGATVLFVGFMVLSAVNSINDPRSPVAADRYVIASTPSEMTPQLMADKVSATATEQIEGVLYPYTGVTYPRVPAPDGSDAECFEVPPGGTVFGATMVLGGSPTELTDIDLVTAFVKWRFGWQPPVQFSPADGVPDPIGQVPARDVWPGTVVCGN